MRILLNVCKSFLPVVVLPLLLAACATLSPAPAPVSDNAAVLALVDQAHAEAAVTEHALNDVLVQPVVRRKRVAHFRV